MDSPRSLQQAANQLAQPQRSVNQAEQELRLMRGSRDAFIKSMRHTGLSYAYAKIKYDNCIDKHKALLASRTRSLQIAETYYRTAYELSLIQPVRA